MEFGRPCREISDAAAQSLLGFSWPGNVRELRNVIRRAILLASEVIEPEHLSFLPADAYSATEPREEPVTVGASLKEIAEAASADAEQQAIRRVLHDTKGNKSEAARLLRTDYKTLHVKMKQYGISSMSFRELRGS
jgi:two-component system nitrogen regulation response regulator GlnG